MIATYSDGCLATAKGAAYSALLAFFPLLTTTATLLIRVKADFVSRQISGFLSEVLPPGTQDLVFYYFAVRGKHPLLVPVTGMLVTVWAASGVIVSLMEGFGAAYRITAARSFIRQRIVALLLVAGAAVPAAAASVLMLFGARAERWLARSLGLLPAGAEELRGWVFILGIAARYALAIGAIAAGAAILYRFGPDRAQRWSGVWPGAVLATALWLATTWVFDWYVRHIANYNVVYGSLAAVMMLLIWMYVLAVIAFIGCEFNAQSGRRAL